MDLKTNVKGAVYPIEIRGDKVFLLSRNTGRELDITKKLSNEDYVNLKHVGKGFGIATDNEHISICYYVNYHTHSEYSLLDGMSKVEDIAKKSSGISAITDHGNMFGMLKWQEAMKKEGKKAIFGFEAYAEAVLSGEKHGNHLILLAKNEVGKKNLFELTSRSFHNFYRKPHVSLDDLQKYHEGIICTSACIASELASIIASDYEGARKVLRWYKDIFGDDYYVEIQRHHIPEEEAAEPLLLKLAKEEGVKVVCANDSHYLNEADAKSHEVLLCVSSKKTLKDPDHFSFNGDGYWFKTDAEMVKDFWDLPETIANTLEIAEKCNLEIETGVYHLPVFPLPEGETSDEAYFDRLVDEGFAKRFSKPDKTYLDRLSYEKGVIKKMGFCSYFLIVQDFINHAKSKGISVGPGRGSAAGSLVAYCLGITELDPIKHGLLFERFLNPDRVSMPDIDTDFEDSRRQEVIDYCKEKYGQENVCNIVTFGRMQAKQAIKDCARVMDFGYEFGDRLSRLVDDKAKNLTEAIENNPELKALASNGGAEESVIKQALKVEGNARNTSIHACGVVISDAPLSTYLPTTLAADKSSKDDKKILTTQVTMTEVEDMGLLKMDFLGLKNMTAISESIEIINKIREKEGYQKISYYRELPLNDPYVYEEISKGKTFAVFQIESEGMRAFMSKLYSDVKSKIALIEGKYGLKGFGEFIEGTGDRESYMKEMESLGNELFERLIAGISLYRPGPMDYIPEFLKNMNNPKAVVYDHPALEPILESTYGVIVYQEQVMQIVRVLAGFSMGQADTIRKAMGKKKQDILDEYKPYFIRGSMGATDSHTGKPLDIKGCISNKIPDLVAVNIWDKMADFAKYAFNKSHAAAYAVICATTAWLKHYYPVPYMTAVINTYISNNDKFKGYISVAKNMGLNILPPDINLSEAKFTTDGTDIRFGLQGLSGLSKNVEAIIKEREENGSYAGLYDFIYRASKLKVNKAATESLILSGAFDSFPCSRKAKVLAVPTLTKDCKKRVKTEGENQLSFFDTIIGESPIDDCPEYEKQEMLELEKQSSGMYITEHPLDSYMDVIKGQNAIEIGLLADDEGNVQSNKGVIAGQITDFTVRYTKKDSRPMGSVVIEDRSGSIKGVLFPDDYDAYCHLLSKGRIVVVSGEIQNHPDFGLQIICKTITDIKDIKDAKTISKVFVKPESKEVLKNVLSVMEKHKGDTPIFAQVGNEVRRFKDGVEPTSSLFMELQEVCGSEFVKFEF